MSQPVSEVHRSLLDRVRDSLSMLGREIAKFGVVGMMAFVIDVGLFNILMYAGGAGPLNDKPLTAKALSVIAATTFAYFGNRFWTFRHRGRTHMGREYMLFFVLNGVGMLIALTCLWFSHYALGLDSPIADNISANVIGLGLGTLFRFWSYRKWVFPAIPADDEADRELAERDASTPI
ncbi:MAG: polysaccharide synthesis protein GtrA [Actinomycetales bacterium mxb001]|nr:MAG: polysaccharide synthesis protein GtrA [Actinomycetales bacterium mxb001]